MTNYRSVKAYALNARLDQGTPFVIFFVFVLAATCLLQWVAHYCSLILTPDSLNYIAASKSFRQTGQFLDNSGKTYFLWPPLFPMLLSFFDDPQHTWRTMHLVLRVVIGLYIFFLAQRMLSSTMIKMAFITVTIAGVHLMMISVFLWSEMIFVFLALTTLFFAYKSDHSIRYFILLLIAGFLLCIQRNAGIFWMTGICLWLVLNPTTSLRSRALKSVFCFAISTSGFWFWNLNHSYFYSKEVSLFNTQFFPTFFHNIYVVLVSMLRLVLPLDGIFGLSIALILLITMIFLLKERFYTDRFVQLVMIMVMMYTIGYLFLNALDKSEIDRYFSPIIILLYLIGFMAFEKIYNRVIETKRPILLTMILLWTTYPVARTINNIPLWQIMSCQSKTNYVIQPGYNYTFSEFKKA